MKSPFRSLPALLVIAVLALVVGSASPALACNQLCHPSLGCITVGWTTWQACHNSGGACIEDQVGDCSASTSVAERLLGSESFVEACPGDAESAEPVDESFSAAAGS